MVNASKTKKMHFKDFFRIATKKVLLYPDRPFVEAKVEQVRNQFRL